LGAFFFAGVFVGGGFFPAGASSSESSIISGDVLVFVRFLFLTPPSSPLVVLFACALGAGLRRLTGGLVGAAGAGTGTTSLSWSLSSSSEEDLMLSLERRESMSYDVLLTGDQACPQPGQGLHCLWNLMVRSCEDKTAEENK
jgi:hypothetical protein